MQKWARDAEQNQEREKQKQIVHRDRTKPACSLPPSHPLISSILPESSLPRQCLRERVCESAHGGLEHKHSTTQPNRLEYLRAMDQIRAI